MPTTTDKINFQSKLIKINNEYIMFFVIINEQSRPLCVQSIDDQK